MNIQVRGRRLKRLLIAGGLVAVLSACAVAVVLWPNDELNAPTEQVVTVAPKPIQITSDILFLGNTFWGRYTHEYAMKSSLGYEYPFSRLHVFVWD